MLVFFAVIFVAAGCYFAMWSQGGWQRIHLTLRFLMTNLIVVALLGVYSYFVNPNPNGLPYVQPLVVFGIITAPVLNLFFNAFAQIKREKESKPLREKG